MPGVRLAQVRQQVVASCGLACTNGTLVGPLCFGT